MSDPSWLQTTWWLLVGVLFTGYAILDGFDLGTGALYLLAKRDAHRQTMLRAIGPVWDGNEVWLITGGGALFAAFPMAYATAFSGFYLALILLLFMLIFRAVSIEVRSAREGKLWRGFWDGAFAVSSTLAPLIMGVALGNIALGVPLTADHEYYGNLFAQLNPYSLLVGVTTVALFMMHGSIYLVLKTPGELNARIRTWVRPTIIFFILMYVITTIATLLYVPHMAEPFKHSPWLFIVPLLSVLAIANVPREIHHNREWRAFLSSCFAIVFLMALYGIGMFPEMIHATIPAHSLTAMNASSSEKTLTVMLIIAAIGMPLVIAYTIAIYYVFRGKVEVDEQGRPLGAGY
ncbi:MAG: Cytochrome bd-I ubiquinol oxidase subunit 2 [Calditrichaeota bacterium]|nr:Cytochrome bd-I ubiquinol oxidase subunit 2 [Calditrichota bacterium]